MSLLILTLPGPGAQSFSYVVSHDGMQVHEHGQAQADQLPSAGRGTEVVGLIPARQLSWHKVRLPDGLGPRSARLQAALAGLLEDHLLQEPDQLHLAIGPSKDAEGNTVVAVCQRAWLQAQLDQLQAAGLHVDRLAPAWPPHEQDDAAAPANILVTGTPGQAQVLTHGSDNLPWLLPLSAVHSGLLAMPVDLPGAPQAQLLAEAAVAAEAENVLGREVELISPAQSALQASQSAWNLAQFEFARHGPGLWLRRLQAAWRQFAHAPVWRPLRWGLLLLILLQFAGIFAWTQQTRQQLRQQKAQIEQIFRQSFPQVPVVVDAELQMQKEVERLQQASGSVAAADLESMLTAAMQALPQAAHARQIEFTTGRLQLDGVQLPEPQWQQARSNLLARDYELTSSASGLVLKLQP